MKRTASALLLSVVPLAACVSPQAETQPPSAPLTAGEQAFTEDYQALRARHGDAAARFVLADVGAGSQTRAITQPVFECQFDEFGIVMGCDRVDEK